MANEQDENEEVIDHGQSVSTRATPRERPKKSGGGGGGFLIFVGLVSCLAGVAMSTLPLLSWKAKQIMVGLDYLGVHGGAICMGGLVMIGLGMLVKGQSALAAGGEDVSEDKLMLEQVASDMLQIHHAIDHLQAITARVQDQVVDLDSTVRAEAEASRSEGEQSNAQDAIFRLAASVDQLGAKIEKRLKTQYQSMQESLDQVTETVVAARHSMESGSSSPAPAPAPTPSAGPSLSMDPSPSKPAAESPAAPAGPSLGVLDSIDDNSPAPLPSRDPQAIHYPDPAGPRGDSGSAGALGAALHLAGDLDSDDPATQEKLDQLNSLLADDRLRAALEGMRPGGE